MMEKKWNYVKKQYDWICTEEFALAKKQGQKAINRYKQCKDTSLLTDYETFEDFQD